MKMEKLDLHGMSLDEALQKTSQNLKWCLEHRVQILDINHGKGLHSDRNFSVIKQEVRRLLKQEPLLKEYGYKLIFGESDFPVALGFDEGHTLVVEKGLENLHPGGAVQKQKKAKLFSEESKQERKMQKSLKALKRKR
jgi:hypothetical protein